MAFFWIAAALLSAAVTIAIVRPLMRAPQPASNDADADVAVYKDQLAEIDADKARGVLSAEDAEAARAEVARRLLRAADSSAPEKSVTDAGAERGRFVQAALAAIPFLALGLYLSVGQPGLPGQPLAARLAKPAGNSDLSMLVAKVEGQLRDHPEDGKGWDVIAPVYASMGRFEDSANAFGNAIRILGETPKRLEGFAMARIRADDGLVKEDARKAFARALELEPAKKELGLWLALAKEQDGDMAGAIADYKALLKDAPQDAAWREPVEARLAKMEAQGAAKAEGTSGKSESGPALEPEEREMAERMVAGLQARLKDKGDDLQGWLMLIRSMKMLARDADAVTALKDARAAMKGNDKALADIGTLAKELGIGP